MIYINNLPNVLNSCYASLYADDTVIYCYGTSSKELSDILGVAKWLHGFKLTLNLDKTKCMLIGSNRKRESKVDLTVSILDHSISNVRSFKYLGIHISLDFTWTDHIEHLTGKVNQKLGLLKRIKHLLPFRARLLFYKSLVMPLFDYAEKTNSVSFAFWLSKRKNLMDLNKRGLLCFSRVSVLYACIFL